MKRPRTYIVLLTLCHCLTACTFGDEPGPCPFNLRLHYWHAGYATENRLPLRVDNLSEYLYDDAGHLLHTRLLRADSLTGYRTTLPPGNYRLVVWGNLNPRRGGLALASASEELAQMGFTAGRDTVPPTYRENTERVYYGAAAFTVPASGVLTQRIYVSHAHANLKVTVVWRGSHPPLTAPLTMRLRGIPAYYSFATGHEIEAVNSAGPHQVPAIGVAETQHETPAADNFNGEVTGEFITLRYTNRTHQLWSLYSGERQLIKELDFQPYFARASTNLDSNVEQEFHLLVTVREDGGIIVTELSGTDWEEGGGFG